MFDFIYQSYRQMDCCVIYTLISYSLYALCRPRRAALRVWQYLLAGTALFAAIYYGIQFCLHLLGFPSPYWIFIFVLAISLLLSSCLFLAAPFLYRTVYILFLLTFIQLYKIVCSPLYELEHILDSRAYAATDLGTGLFFYVLLILFGILFGRVRLSQKISIVPEKYLLVLYFPVSILLSTLITANNTSLWLRFAPILAAIILTNLPIVYYFFTAIIDSYEKQRELNNALQQTRAQLSHYRYSILLQDEIRKERHELRNNYFYIQTLVTGKKYDALEEYIKNMIGSVQNYLVCQIKNSTDRNVLKVNPHFHTTKGECARHGFGIKIIRETVREQNGILKFDSGDNYFSATVMLPFENADS